MNKNETQKNNYYTLTYIFTQELFENDLLNIEELAKKIHNDSRNDKHIKKYSQRIIPRRLKGNK